MLKHDNGVGQFEVQATDYIKCKGSGVLSRYAHWLVKMACFVKEVGKQNPVVN